MKRALTIVAAVALAAFVGGAAVAQMGETPQVPRGPEQTSKMMQMITQMQEQMNGKEGMGPMQGRMGQMMGMMGQMQGMMTQHQEMMKRLCPRAMGGQAPKQGG